MGILALRVIILIVLNTHYLLFNAIHYLCHIDHDIVGAIQSSCYTCGVRHGLTLAISPKPLEKFRPVINQSVRSYGVKLIPEVGVIFRGLLLKVISDLLCMLYNLCIVSSYYPLFVAIYEIWLLRLTYGAYLVLFLKSGIIESNKNERILNFVLEMMNSCSTIIPFKCLVFNHEFF